MAVADLDLSFQLTWVLGIKFRYQALCPGPLLTEPSYKLPFFSSVFGFLVQDFICSSS